MNNANNPYAPPAARVADLVETNEEDGSFIRNGRTVPAGHGANWLGAAWRMFKQSPGSWLLLLLIAFIIFCTLSFIPIVNLAVAIVGPLLYGGIFYAGDQQRKTGTVEVGNLFEGLRQRTNPLLVLGAINLAFMAICGGVFALAAGGDLAWAMFISRDPAVMSSALSSSDFALGMLLYMGVTFLMMAAMWFSPALVMLHGVAPVEALKISFLAAFRNILPGIVYSILLFILLIVAAIPLLLGYLIVMPMFAISFYTAYRDIFIES